MLLGGDAKKYIPDIVVRHAVRYQNPIL